MKKLLLILLLIPNLVFGAALTWDASPGATGYKVYYTDGVGSWDNILGDVLTVDTSVLNPNCDISYTAHVTAYNGEGESGPSNTVVYVESCEYVPTENPKPPVGDIIPPTNLGV